MFKNYIFIQTYTIMETKYLLLSAGTATFGFLIWYAMSASLRLTKTFQIQFDINTPFVNRFLRRRLLMFLLYVIVPLLFIFKWKVLGHVSLEDVGIRFSWNNQATLWFAILIPVALIYNVLSGSKEFNLVEYPEIRVTRWTPKLLVLSGLTWCLQIFALELLYRGFLLQSVLAFTQNEMIAIIISTGVYALSQYFRRNRISVFSIPYGALACYIVLQTGSLLPVMFIHLANALFNEWISIKKHPEIKLA